MGTSLAGLWAPFKYGLVNVCPNFIHLSQGHPALYISGRGAADGMPCLWPREMEIVPGVFSTEFPAGPAPSSTTLRCPSLPRAVETAFARPGLQTLKSHHFGALVSCHHRACALGPSPCAQPRNPTRTRAPGRHQALSRPPAPGPGAHRGNRLGGVWRVLLPARPLAPAP